MNRLNEDSNSDCNTTQNEDTDDDYGLDEEYLASLPDPKVPSLYTVADIKEYREMLLSRQNGIDPITGETLLAKDAVLDHDHVSQHCRGTLHRQSNAFEGLVANAYRRCLSWSTEIPLPIVLRNLADYLEVDYSGNAYHVGWMKRCLIDFKKLTASKQRAVLEAMDKDTEGNGKVRIEKFKAALLTKGYGYATVKYLLDQAQELD